MLFSAIVETDDSNTNCCTFENPRAVTPRHENVASPLYSFQYKPIILMTNDIRCN
jgi:hypothetical protein